jgi:hypothetical protein
VSHCAWPKILIIKFVIVIVLLMFQIYSCAPEVYSRTVIFYLKHQAHIDLNIWPLSICLLKVAFAHN